MRPCLQLVIAASTARFGVEATKPRLSTRHPDIDGAEVGVVHACVVAVGRDAMREQVAGLVRLDDCIEARLAVVAGHDLPNAAISAVGLDLGDDHDPSSGDRFSVGVEDGELPFGKDRN